MPEPTRPDEPHSWWQALVRGADGRAARLVVLASDTHPDGTRVELSDSEVDQLTDPVVCTAELAGGEVVRLLVSPTFAPRAPAMWFVELSPESDPSATDLLAFAGLGLPTGALVSTTRGTGPTLDGVDVTSADQLGALRWRPASGEVDQVYVQPEWRRRQIGSVLIAATACLAVARDQPRLWTDGQRTELGERLTSARSWRDRSAPLTHIAPPMTPTQF